jgi:hypothetical protein
MSDTIKSEPIIGLLKRYKRRRIALRNKIADLRKRGLDKERYDYIDVLLDDQRHERWLRKTFNKSCAK